MTKKELHAAPSKPPNRPLPLRGAGGWRVIPGGAINFSLDVKQDTDGPGRSWHFPRRLIYQFWSFVDEIHIISRDRSAFFRVRRFPPVIKADGKFFHVGPRCIARVTVPSGAAYLSSTPASDRPFSRAQG
jgi:hypothetical protein